MERENRCFMIYYKRLPPQSCTKIRLRQIGKDSRPYQCQFLYLLKSLENRLLMQMTKVIRSANEMWYYLWVSKTKLMLIWKVKICKLLLARNPNSMKKSKLQFIIIFRTFKRKWCAIEHWTKKEWRWNKRRKWFNTPFKTQ